MVLMQDKAHAARSNSRRSTTVKTIVIPLIMMLVGLAILVYPVVATQWNNYRANEIARSYSQHVYSLTDEQRHAIVDAAREYNKDQAAGVFVDPWSQSVDHKSPQYQEYLHQLDTVEAMAQLIIPKIKVDLPVYHGTDIETLDRGIGHLYGSSLPVGGPGTHSVLTGHTGFNNATLLDNLNQMKVGDDFYINTVDGPLKYEVDQIKVVLPDDTKDLKAVPGADYVTLVTCTPYGINSHRLLVRGHRVDYVPQTDSKEIASSTAFVWQWWMTAVIVAVLIIVLCICLWLFSLRRSSKKQAVRSPRNDH